MSTKNLNHSQKVALRMLAGLLPKLLSGEVRVPIEPGQTGSIKS